MLKSSSPFVATAALQPRLCEHFVVNNYCTWNDVIPAPPLESFTAFNRFRVVHYDETDFGLFHVMEKEVMQDGLFHLKEEIQEVLLAEKDGNDMTLKETPEFRQVVLAPNPDHKNEYQRAVVEKLHLVPEKSHWEFGENMEDVSSVTVYFFDFGGYHKIKMADLKSVTMQILQFPVLSYKVMLYTDKRSPLDNSLIPFNSDGLILLKSFRLSMDKYKRLDWIITVKTEEMSTLTLDHDFVSTYPVSIQYDLKLRPSSLVDKLEELTVWEWEKSSIRRRSDKPDDDYLTSWGLFGEAERTISTYTLETGIEFNAVVTRVMESSTSTSSSAGECLEIRVIQLDEPVYKNYFGVLHRQLDHYAKKIAKSRYVPGIKDIFMFRLEKKPEYSRVGVKNLGEWCRALRTHLEWIYLMDWDQIIPLKGMEENDYEMRPLYGEFLQIPELVVFLTPYENGTRMSYIRAKILFNTKSQQTQRHRFRVKGEDKENSTFEVEYLGQSTPARGETGSKYSKCIKGRSAGKEIDSTTTNLSDSE